MTMDGDTWQEVRIGDLGDVFTGRTPPSERPAYFGEAYPFITPGDMRQGKYVRATQRNVSLEGAELLKRLMLPPNSVCVSCIGWQMGEVIMTSQSSFTNQQINSIVPNRTVDPSFLYYSLRPRKQELLSLGAATGVRTPILNKSGFCDLKVKLPSLPTQKRIADILSAYDDLIENNRRRMEMLEKMAQALYNAWFVEFRYPGHKKVPLVESSMGAIPTGWEVAHLGDHLASLETGKRPKGGATSSEGGIPSIGAENINGIGVHDYSSEKYVPRVHFDAMRRGVVQDRDVALYKDGAHIGRSAYFRDGFPHSECCVNEHVFILRANGDRLKQNALYLWLREPQTILAVRATNTNAAQPGLNQEGISGLQIVLPTIEIAKRFDWLVEAILAQIINLSKQNRTLSQTRDLLLPRLLSGQIDISAIEKEEQVAA